MPEPMSNQHRYAVWAPTVDSMAVVVGADGDQRHEMTRLDSGWWEVEADQGDGRYAFSINGNDPRPDPRSLSQPDGVHAASELVDLSSFEWTDDGWEGVEMPDAVVYEMHIGTFTPEGTFDAAIVHLDYLRDLGVTVLEILPVAAFPGKAGWGYDGVNLYAVYAQYGGAEAFARFINAAHERGLAVWLDVVYNHFGPSGNYLKEYGPYFTQAYHTPWGEAVNLDGFASDGVRAFILDNVAMWLGDFHLDGLRLDAVHELHDRRAVHILEEMAALADEITEETDIPRNLIAESDRNDPATVAPRGTGGVGGFGLHGQWVDDVHHALHVHLTGETQGYYSDFADPEALEKVLGQTPFFHDGTYSSFRVGTHGTKIDPSVTPGYRFVASLQTHDQIGNRAVGDRLAHLTSDGMAAIGAALLLTSPYTPMLFMGEEWAASTKWQYFTDHAEEWLADAIREGRAAEFAEHGWSDDVPDPQDESTVEASTLNWDEVTAPAHARMHDWYQTLLRLRREVPALRDTPLGESRVEHNRELRTIIVQRGNVTVVANRDEDEQVIKLPGDTDGQEVLAAWGSATINRSSAPATITLGGHDVAVIGGV
ncbi:malto-oligosyltrehalose trehalohydrolase [Ornithinimicrobium sp. Arc0846-15]|nr:malto-oligosyltrehalose trehalohydrolase [Ornithinimicrobium laminariae]